VFQRLFRRRSFLLIVHPLSIRLNGNKGVTDVLLLLMGLVITM
jgi:hypothetical protein